jgi:hypothetical protein
MFSPYFSIPGYTFSLNRVIGFSDVKESTDEQTWEYSVQTTAAIYFVASFSCQEEAKKSHDKLKEALGVFDQTFSFEELA